MENLQGGDCTLGAGVILESSALIADVASGPIGWAFLAIAAVSFAIALDSCDED